MPQSLPVWRYRPELLGPLLLVRKLGSPGWLNAVAARLLVHIVDSSNHRRYLVDRGASYSILPHKSPLPAT